MFAEQSEAAIAAGAFHNDVVAVANERVLFAHELAFADKEPLLSAYAGSADQLIWARAVMGLGAAVIVVIMAFALYAAIHTLPHQT